MKAYERYKLLERTLETDTEFLELEGRSQELAPRVLEIRNALSAEQWEVLTEFFGVSQEMGWRMAELACFMPE